MEVIDVNGILREAKFFTENEINIMFHDNSTIFDPVVIDMDARIAELQWKMNLIKEQHKNYSEIAAQLDCVRKKLNEYTTEKNKKFAHVFVRSMLAKKGMNLDILHAYFLGLVRVPRGAKLSPRRQSCMNFVDKYALPEFKKLQEELIKSTERPAGR